MVFLFLFLVCSRTPFIFKRMMNDSIFCHFVFHLILRIHYRPHYECSVKEKNYVEYVTQLFRLIIIRIISVPVLVPMVHKFSKMQCNGRFFSSSSISITTPIPIPIIICGKLTMTPQKYLYPSFSLFFFCSIKLFFASIHRPENSKTQKEPRIVIKLG